MRGMPTLGASRAIATNTITHGKYRYIQWVSTSWKPIIKAPANAKARVASSRRGTKNSAIAPKTSAALRIF